MTKNSNRKIPANIRSVQSRSSSGNVYENIVGTSGARS
jgi:hypothetical protein